MKRIKLEELKKRLYKIYPDQIFNFENYKNTSSKIELTDPIYGKWTPTIKNLLSKKRKCTKRYLNERIELKLTKKQIKDKIFKVHKGLIKIDINSYINTATKCKFIDIDFGEFYMTPQHVFQGSGHKSRGILKQIKSQQLPLNEVKKRLSKIHNGDITIIDNTYNGMYHKATFIHKKYGNWEALPNNVIYKKSSHPSGGLRKQINTCLKNYGTKHPLQNKKIFYKVIKSRWRRVIINHWKTNEELVCISSYEYAVIYYLNKNKIDFDWQIKKILSNDMVYFVDLYLKNEDLYIEIKGYFFSEKNKLKWELFHASNKNSEIWFINKISELTSKSKYIIKKEFDIEHKKQHTIRN